MNTIKLRPILVTGLSYEGTAMSDNPAQFDFDTMPYDPDNTVKSWNFVVPRSGLWRYENLSVRIPDDHKYQAGDRVTLTYNDSTYETVIDSIAPDGRGFVRVAAHFLLPTSPPEYT